MTANNGLPTKDILVRRVSDLQFKIYQLAGVCDVLASATDPDTAGALPLERLSVQNVAMVLRDTLNELANGQIDRLLSSELIHSEKRGSENDG